MKLHESGEMYLETILILSRKNPYVRAIDVGEYMGFSKPSVSRALSLLRSGGFVEVGESGGLILTETGREIAEKFTKDTAVCPKFLKKWALTKRPQTPTRAGLSTLSRTSLFKRLKGILTASKASIQCEIFLLKPACS